MRRIAAPVFHVGSRAALYHLFRECPARRFLILTCGGPDAYMRRWTRTLRAVCGRFGVPIVVLRHALNLCPADCLRDAHPPGRVDVLVLTGVDGQSGSVGRCTHVYRGTAPRSANMVLLLRWL